MLEFHAMATPKFPPVPHGDLLPQLVLVPPPSKLRALLVATGGGKRSGRAGDSFVIRWREVSVAGPLGLPERYALVTCLLPVYRWYHTVGVVTDRVSLASPPYPSRVFRVERLHSRYSTKICSFADE